MDAVLFLSYMLPVALSLMVSLLHTADDASVHVLLTVPNVVSPVQKPPDTPSTLH